METNGYLLHHQILQKIIRISVNFKLFVLRNWCAICQQAKKIVSSNEECRFDVLQLLVISSIIKIAFYFIVIFFDFMLFLSFLRRRRRQYKLIGCCPSLKAKKIKKSQTNGISILFVFLEPFLCFVVVWSRNRCHMVTVRCGKWYRRLKNCRQRLIYRWLA